jgi:hypothetical protein
MNALIETLKLVIARKVTMKDLLDAQNKIDNMVLVASGMKEVKNEARS